MRPRHREAGRVERWTWIHEGGSGVKWGVREPRIQYGKVGRNPSKEHSTDVAACGRRRGQAVRKVTYTMLWCP